MVHSSDWSRTARALLVGLAVFAFSGGALAQWAWKDDNGRVVYSDRPPPAGVKSDQHRAAAEQRADRAAAAASRHCCR